MKEVVLVPTFQRDELLYVCLEHIREAHPSIAVVVFADRGWGSAELTATCQRFGARLINREMHGAYGNTLNVIEAYKWAFIREYERIYLVEDDVMVGKDFFSWHINVHADPTIFCSCAWVLDSWERKKLWFASIGVCFMRAKLAQVVAHAKPEYYFNLQEYVRANFPISKIASNCGDYEQDGLILRLMELDKSKASWPQNPKCRHLGWWGYNRQTGVAPTGTFEERIEAVRRVMRKEHLAEKHFGKRLVKKELGLPYER